ncbi:MAG: SulP family inorganic anion transporter [Polyangiaceae bacterium]|nr:SulP family inorganic anion transporter [Polyangiaceae bacterium]
MHALLLLAVLLVICPLASQIPMAVLAGILITVGIGIVDSKGLRHAPSAPRGDASVMVVVLLMTMFVDLMNAVAVGMVMAAMILLKRMSDLDPATHSPLVEVSSHRTWMPSLTEAAEVLSGVCLVELHGALFFGNAGPLQCQFEGVEKTAQAVVLHMGDVRYLDQSGVYMLAELVGDLNKNGTEVFVGGLRQEPAEITANLEVAPGAIPAGHIFDRPEEAIKAAAKWVRVAQSMAPERPSDAPAPAREAVDV